MANETVQDQAEDMQPGNIAFAAPVSRKVRVLRILEYIYETGEIAQRDMQGWHVPAQGRLAADFDLPDGVTIRSGILIAPFDEDFDGDSTLSIADAAVADRLAQGRAAVVQGGLQVGRIGFDEPYKPFSQQKAEEEARQRADLTDNGR